MSPLNENYLLLQAFIERIEQLHDLLGEDLYVFGRQIVPLLERISTVEDETEIQILVDEFLEICMSSPIAPLSQKILAEVQAMVGGGTIDAQTKGRRLGTLSETTGPATTLSDIIQAAQELAWSLAPLEQAAAQRTEKRYLNTFFTEIDSPETIPLDEALIHNRAYNLYVEISPERKGPGEEDTPFPDAVLEQVWDEQEALPLTVWASSRDFKISSPQIQTLHLTPSGDSPGVLYPIVPIIEDGHGRIMIEIYYQGHLLQAKQMEVLVIPRAGIPLPDSVKPPQRARITFTTMVALDPYDFVQFPERLLTIDVSLDPRDGSIAFRFLDRTQGDEQLASYDTELQNTALNEAVSKVREQLRAMVVGIPQLEGYEWRLEGSQELLEGWLARLALVGHQLYEALLPKQTDPEARGRLGESMKPGTVIQINPITGKTTLPWGILYEKDIKYVPGRIRLCDQYKAHGPGQSCPYHNDPYVICPFSFWGYRYAIEQLPCWVTGEMPQYPMLVREVTNSRPLMLNLNVWRDFSLWQEHCAQLQSIGQVEVLVAEEVAKLEQIWSEHNPRLDVVYFYCHGGSDDLLGPYLQLSDAAINSDFLKASKIQWEHAPLVFLNGCATGDYTPESYINLIDDFRVGGASGVVGTECPVPELFAEAFARELFPRIFRGERLGEAILETRLHFLLEKANPLGLLYTLYAANEVSLSYPIT